MAETLSYNPLIKKARVKNYYHTVDELVFQEHSDREVTGLDYLAFSSLQVRVRLGSD